MTAARFGVKRHIEVESIERLTKWLLSKGFNAHDAQRGAVQISLVLCGDYSRAEAREAAIEITAQRNAPPVKVTLTDQIDPTQLT